ncbi:MAG: hypothetical protein F6K65_33380, partial [Moorea sp. SIO3C2]|nr:hypothetical protein [Moorena sp. SIO3C2]
MAVVEKGDLLSLSPTTGTETNIEWQQNLIDRNKIFKVVPFVVKDSKASGTLFIESSMAEEFLSLCEKDESENPFSPSNNYKVQVNDKFQ